MASRKASLLHKTGQPVKVRLAETYEQAIPELLLGGGTAIGVEPLEQVVLRASELLAASFGFVRHALHALQEWCRRADRGVKCLALIIAKKSHKLEDCRESLYAIDDVPNALLVLRHEDARQRNPEQNALYETRLLGIWPPENSLKLGVNVELVVAVQVLNSPIDIGYASVASCRR